MAPRKQKKQLAAPPKSAMADFDEIEWYTNLLPLCEGNRGGGEGEWVWGGPKGGNPTIYCSNLAVAVACVRRRAPAKIRVHGGSTPHALTLLYAAKHVRKPETLIRPGKENRDPSPELAAIAARCEHKSGSSEAEWTVSRVNGDKRVQFYTSILASAGRLLYRNPEALIRPELLLIGGEPDGFSAWVPSEFVRRPETLIRPDTEADNADDGADGDNTDDGADTTPNDE